MSRRTNLMLKSSSTSSHFLLWAYTYLGSDIFCSMTLPHAKFLQGAFLWCLVVASQCAFATRRIYGRPACQRLCVRWSAGGLPSLFGPGWPVRLAGRSDTDQQPPGLTAQPLGRQTGLCPAVRLIGLTASDAAHTHIHTRAAPDTQACIRTTQLSLYL